MRYLRLPRHQSGFSLLEVLLAIGVAIAVGSMQLTRIKDDTERIQSSAVGEQLQLAGEALNRYISLQRNNLINGTSISGDGDMVDPGPRTCVAITTAQGPGWQCSITTQTLQGVGLLPLSFAGVNAFGSGYEYLIRVEGTAPDWRLEGVVRTVDPYMTGGQIRHDLIGQALNQAGSEAGAIVDNSGTIRGLNGLWVENNWGFGVSQEGMLAYRAGFGTGGFNEVLRIDGSNEFTDDLDMGSTPGFPHSIEHINEVHVGNDIRGAGFQAKTHGPGALTLGQDDPANQIEFGNDGNRLNVRAVGGLQLLDGAGNPTEMNAGDLDVGSVTARGYGNFVGSLESEGLSTAGGHNIVSLGAITAEADFVTEEGNFITHSGSFNTTNGNISTQTGRIIAEDLNIGGGAAIRDQLRFGTLGHGWFYDHPSNTMTLGNTSDLAVEGEIRGRTIQSSTHIEAESFIIGAEQAPGTTCDSNTFATDGQGRMMECVDGVYTLLGGVKRVVPVNGTIAGPGAQATAGCPSGMRMVGGGWLVTQRNTPDTDPYAPSKSYGDAGGNRWIIENIGTSHTAAFQAQVVCAE